MSGARVPYAGIATRTLALAIDVTFVHVVVFTAGAILALVGSLVGDLRLDTLARLLAAGAWAATVSAYFAGFWSMAGQTPAMRLMEIRVLGPGGEPPGVLRAFVRLVGLGLAIVPLFAGFLPVLVDDRRRGLHDFMAGTVVVHAGPDTPALGRLSAQAP